MIEAFPGRLGGDAMARTLIVGVGANLLARLLVVDAILNAFSASARLGAVVARSPPSIPTRGSRRPSPWSGDSPPCDCPPLGGLTGYPA
ncbi:MAG: hypothetical protein GY698_20250 [Actinomycetia bacterium]|nr:hypothetical protein [Actinomycetes bacterium]